MTLHQENSRLFQINSLRNQMLSLNKNNNKKKITKTFLKHY